MANKKQIPMQNIDLNFIKKFWLILARLDRHNSKNYPNETPQRGIFVDRVAKLFIKSGSYRFAINGKFYIASLSPAYFKFGYNRADDICLWFFPINKGSYETLLISHNDSLKVSWVEVAEEKILEFSDFCLGSIQERFMNEYSSTQQFFEKDISLIKKHKTTRLIYKKLSGNIKEKLLKEVAIIILNTCYWDETGFYINSDKTVKQKMPSGEAWFYLEDVKKIFTKLGYLNFKKEGLNA